MLIINKPQTVAYHHRHACDFKSDIIINLYAGISGVRWCVTVVQSDLRSQKLELLEIPMWLVFRSL